MQELADDLVVDDATSILFALIARMSWYGLLTGIDIVRIEWLLDSLGYVIKKAA